MAHPPLRLAWVLLPIFVGVALRLAILFAFPDMPLHGDEVAFYEGALQLVAGEEVDCFPFRPPLYIGFCALVVRGFGSEPDAIRITQCLLEGLTILGVFLLGRRAFGDRAGVAAAWLVALYPDFIAYSHYLWSETLGLALIPWALLALVALRDRPSWSRVLVVGAAWGTLALVKPFHLYMLPAALLWLVAATPADRRAGAVLRAAGTLLIALLVLTPWTLHVSREAGRFIPISTIGEKNLSTGVNILPPPQTDFASTGGSTQRQRNLEKNQRDVGLVAFILDDPGLFTSRAWEKMSYLWSPNSVILRNIYSSTGRSRDKSPKYGPPKAMPAALRLAAVWATLGSSMALTIGLLLGLWLTRASAFTALAAVYVGLYLAMITMTPALSRYRLPLMIFAFVFSGAVLTGAVPWRALGERKGAIAGAAVCLGAVVVLWSMRLPQIVSEIW